MARKIGVTEITDILKLTDTEQGRCCSVDFDMAIKWPVMINRQGSVTEKPKCPDKIADQRKAYVETLMKTFEKFQGQVDIGLWG